MLITCDALRPDHLSCYGYERKTSPVIDSLAESGLRYSQAIAQTTWTIPAMYSILTSTYPHSHGMITKSSLYTKLNPSLPLLSKILKKAGYRTGLFSNHAWFSRLKKLGFQKYFILGFPTGDEYDTHIKRGQWVKKDATEKATKEIMEWAVKAHSKPFFLWVHYLSPHYPFIEDLPENKLFINDKFYNKYDRVPVERIFQWARLGDNTDPDFYIALYDADIKYIDAKIGMVLQSLKNNNMYSNTIVVLSADHGESLGEKKFFFGHRDVPYDCYVRIPLIISWPGVLDKKEIPYQVQQIDISPTLLTLAGIGIPTAMQEHDRKDLESLRETLKSLGYME
ncbi:sulfatase [Spirochaetota bacterium]